MAQDSFQTNLIFACSLYPSVAEVCRRLGVNRQQFNKYLSGQVRPSRHNMRRICDFFGVTEWEMLLDEDRFRDLFSVRRTPRPSQTLTVEQHHLERLHRASGTLDHYLGYYYRYFYAFGYPGKIIKSLAVITKSDNNRYYWKNVEFTPGKALATDRAASKYVGTVFHLGDRICVVEYEALMASSITTMTLYPSYHTRIDYLLGVQTGGSTKRGRRPAASLVLLEYLGREIDLRRAYARLGVFDESEIDARIRGQIRNRIPDGAYVLEAEEQ